MDAPQRRAEALVRERAFVNPHPESTSLDVTYTFGTETKSFF